ncbi:MAG: Unknown protein [uncultured Sulfurovum sp.]|uniref:HupE-UreJ family metal transporter n=1 Tax=uncultured Sulfurovum sp. TaxID=269237 RepID=A0A6S6SGR4_9BACT|nr:MAG: Unknown protein [uncultured Sulfurovum sp.]
MNINSFATIFLLALVSTQPALAHSPIQGIGDFYNGLLHPILVPAHLLLLVAIGFFGGQQGLDRVKPVLGMFTLATVAGLIIAWFSISIEFEIFILILSAVIGLLIVIKPKVSLFWCGLIALLAGFLLGIDSAQEALSGKDKLVTLFGTSIGINLLALYSIGFADYFNKKAWQQIGIRIIGSWVSASALLVLALSFSSQA